MLKPSWLSRQREYSRRRLLVVAPWPCWKTAKVELLVCPQREFVHVYVDESAPACEHPRVCGAHVYERAHVGGIHQNGFHPYDCAHQDEYVDVYECAHVHGCNHAHERVHARGDFHECESVAFWNLWAWFAFPSSIMMHKVP